MTRAADEPDTSERFREAMSACTLPGPGIEPRLARLAETGWTAATPDAGDAAAFRDAALIAATPDPTPENWEAKRAEGPVALPGTVHRNGLSRLIVIEDAAGNPSCRLATLNSVDSDLLFDDLSGLGVVTVAGPVREAAMASTIFDTATGNWRTEVSLTSADTAAANALLSEPLATTLMVSFVTRPRQ